jgi:hypothetical protein
MRLDGRMKLSFMLDLMLADIRRHSTADVIVPSLHLMGHEDADPDRWAETFQAGCGFPIRTRWRL